MAEGLAGGAPRFHAPGDGLRIAFRFTPASGETPAPGVVFLPGYRSDMAGSKAVALFAAAAQAGHAALLFDYSGCGLSDGDFAEGTLMRWRDEALALIEAHCPGPLVLVGSSMGGWLMLLIALALPAARIAGLIGIAAAPDFTDWGYDAAQKAALAAEETVWEDNPYGPDPTPTHAGFWHDGQRHLLLGQEIALDCPVHLLHGQSDGDVPVDISLRLAAALRSARVQVHLVKGGDHRLSRPADLALLATCVADLMKEA